MQVVSLQLSRNNAGPNLALFFLAHIVVYLNLIIFIYLKYVLCRSLKSSAAGVVLYVLVLHPKTHQGSIQTPCPSMPALTWSPKVASGQKHFRRSSPMRETSSRFGWIRKAGCSIESTTPAPYCSSAGYMSQNPSGLS